MLLRRYVRRYFIFPFLLQIVECGHHDDNRENWPQTTSTPTQRGIPRLCSVFRQWMGNIHGRYLWSSCIHQWASSATGAAGYSSIAIGSFQQPIACTSKLPEWNWSSNFPNSIIQFPVTYSIYPYQPSGPLCWASTIDRKSQVSSNAYPLIRSYCMMPIRIFEMT